MSKKIKKIQLPLYLLLLILPILGFLVGVHFGKYVNKNEKETILPLLADNDTYRKLIAKCGDIPTEKLSLPTGHYVSISKKLWSNDCNYIAWSVFNTGTVVINPNGGGTSVKGNAEEGIFIYDVKTEKQNKLALNENIYKSPSFSGWKNDNTIIFSSIYNGRVNATYNVDDKTISSPEDIK